MFSLVNRGRGLWGGALLLFSSLAAQAQLETGGRLRGTITDPSNAAIVGAKIALSDPATGRSRTGNSNERGEYLIPDIPAGSYRLEVEAVGFRRAVLEAVTIRLNQTQTLNLALVVGATSETVTVTVEDGGVSQQSMLYGVIDPVRLSELPTNARNWTNLLVAVPGVTRASRATGRGTFSSGGSRPTANQFYVDGGDANDFLLPTTIRTDFLTSGIPIEAIDQFTVITANPTAEYGHSSGAILNAVTRSGSNQLHGSLWEFLRNDALDSRIFFDPPGEKPPLRQHEFGVRIGGPLARDRAFFSAAYSGFRARRETSLVATVPSASFFQNAAADPNHSPLLLAVMRAAFPAPDPGTTDPANPNRATAVRVVDHGGNQDSFFLRLDYRLNPQHNLYATLNQSEGLASGLGAIPGRFGYRSVRNWFFVTTHLWNITPASLNTVRFSWQRFSYDSPWEPQNPATLEAGRLRTAGPFAGEPYDAANDTSNGFPHIDFRFTGLGFDSLGIGPLQPQRGVVTTWLFTESFSAVQGAHFWKVGGEARGVHADVELDELIRPVIFLGNATTGDIFLQQQNFHRNGDPLRHDRISEVSLFLQDTWRVHPRLSLELGLRYELNLPMTEAGDLQSNMYVMEGDRPVPCHSLPYGAGMKNVALVVPSQHGISLYCTDKNNFAPRVGFAWDVFGDSRTVLRGAYGIFYDRLFGTMVSRARFNPPFVLSTSISFPGVFDGSQASPVLDQTQVVAATTVDPDLRSPYVQRWNLTLARELDRRTALNVSYIGSRGLKLFQTERPNFGATFPDRFRPSQAGDSQPRSQVDLDGNIIRAPFGAITARTSAASSDYHGLQVDLSRRFAAGLTFTAGYSWAHSLDTISDEDLGLVDSAIPQATLHNLLAGLLVPNSPCAGAATTAASSSVTQARLLAAVRCATGNPALAVADAGRIFIDQFVTRASPAEGRGDSAFDVRQRFFSSVVYELPLGPGKRFAGQANGVLGRLASGWEIAGVFESQTGTPLPILAGVDANRDGDPQSRAVLTGDPASATFPSGIEVGASGGTPIVRQLTCQTTGSGGALQCVTPFGRGEGIIDPRQRIGRGRFRQQGIWNLDLMLAKRTKLWERVTLQFRAEAFNVLNHVQFGPPAQAISDPNFGRIFAQRELASTSPFTSGQLSRQIQLGIKLEF